VLNFAFLFLAVFENLLFLDQGKLEFGVRCSIPQVPFPALGANPVEQGGHVCIVMNEDVVVLINKAFELTVFIIALELQKGEHCILHNNLPV